MKPWWRLIDLSDMLQPQTWLEDQEPVCIRTDRAGEAWGPGWSLTVREGNRLLFIREQ